MRQDDVRKLTEELNAIELDTMSKGEIIYFVFDLQDKITMLKNVKHNSLT